MALVDTHTNDNIIDIDLSATRKKRFRINGDNNRILELDTSDFSIIKRLNTIYPKLNKLMQEAAQVMSVDDGDDVSAEESIAKASDALTDIDNKMREYLDELFDTNVSEVCAPSGSMYDPFAGKFRYEHIIETLSSLYENNFNREFNLMRERVQKHTDKYTRK